MALNLTNEEMQKKLLQAQHRAEEAAARNRKKADRERTHRLCQMGAILGSVFPDAWTMDLNELKAVLKARIRET